MSVVPLRLDGAWTWDVAGGSVGCAVSMYVWESSDGLLVAWAFRERVHYLHVHCHACDTQQRKRTLIISVLRSEAHSICSGPHLAVVDIVQVYLAQCV